MNFPYWHKLLGIVFILLSLYMYFFQQKIQIRPTLGNALLFCGAGGILGGLFGVGGPPAKKIIAKAKPLIPCTIPARNVESKSIATISNTTSHLFSNFALSVLPE